MHAWEAIQKTVDYIEENLDCKIEIQRLADIAALSSFYYQRLFAKLVNSPVNEYIKMRRLAKACDCILTTKNRILDIALQYGFHNHETFTRTFKRTYGITPESYRKKPVMLDHFDKPELKLSYMMVDIGIPLIADDFMIEYHFKTITEDVRFVGVNGYYQFKSGKMFGERPGVSEPEMVWKEFLAIKNQIKTVENPKLIAVSYPGDANEGYSSYFVGLESCFDLTNSKLTTWTLPAREYLICGFETEHFKDLTTIVLGKAMKHIKYWLRDHDLTADGFFPEIHLSNIKETAYMEMWIPFKKRDNK